MLPPRSARPARHGRARKRPRRISATTDDDRTIVTAWDPTGIADWALHQSVVGAGGLLVTETTLADDGSFAVTLGEGAAPMVLAASEHGALQLAAATSSVALAGEMALPAGTTIRWLPNGVAVVEATAVAGAAAVAATLFVSDATIKGWLGIGGDANVVQLAANVRLTFEGSPGQVHPVLQELWSDGTWMALMSVPMTTRADGVLAIDADALRDAVGQEVIDLILANAANNPYIDVAAPPISLSPVPVLPNTLSSDSIFSGGGATTVYGVPGPAIDWSAPGLQPATGAVAVMEMRGLSWTSGQDLPYVGHLTSAEVSNACPALGRVQSSALVWDEVVRTQQPELDPMLHGTAVHVALAAEVIGWGPNFHAELSLLGGDDRGNTRPAGSSVLDILEKVGDGTVCVYDIKTGSRPMSAATMERYWREAKAFDPTATRILVIQVNTR